MLLVPSAFTLDQQGEIVFPEDAVQAEQWALKGYLATETALKITCVRQGYDAYYLFEVNLSPGNLYEPARFFVDPAKLQPFFKTCMQEMSEKERQEALKILTTTDANTPSTPSSSNVQKLLRKMDKDGIFRKKALKKPALFAAESLSHWRLKAANSYIARAIKILTEAHANQYQKEPKFIVAITGIENSIITDVVEDALKRTKDCWPSPETVSLSVAEGAKTEPGAFEHNIDHYQIDSIFEADHNLANDINNHRQYLGLATVILFNNVKSKTLTVEALPGKYNTSALVRIPLFNSNIFSDPFSIYITRLEIDSQINQQQINKIADFISIKSEDSLESKAYSEPEELTCKFPALLAGCLNSTPNTIEAQEQAFPSSPDSKNRRISGGRRDDYFLSPYSDRLNERVSKFDELPSIMKTTFQEQSEAGKPKKLMPQAMMNEKVAITLRKHCTENAGNQENVTCSFPDFLNDTLMPLLASNNFLLITGASGTGKTTKLIFLATQLKQKYGDEKVLLIDKQYKEDNQFTPLCTTGANDKLLRDIKEKVMAEGSQIRFVLLDEVDTGFCTQDAKDKMGAFVSDLKKVGITIVATTHYEQELASFADNMITLSKPAPVAVSSSNAYLAAPSPLKNSFLSVPAENGKPVAGRSENTSLSATTNTMQVSDLLPLITAQYSKTLQKKTTPPNTRSSIALRGNTIERQKPTTDTSTRQGLNLRLNAAQRQKPQSTVPLSRTSTLLNTIEARKPTTHTSTKQSLNLLPNTTQCQKLQSTASSVNTRSSIALLSNNRGASESLVGEDTKKGRRLPLQPKILAEYQKNQQASSFNTQSPRWLNKSREGLTGTTLSTTGRLKNSVLLVHEPPQQEPKKAANAQSSKNIFEIGGDDYPINLGSLALSTPEKITLDGRVYQLVGPPRSGKTGLLKYLDSTNPAIKKSGRGHSNQKLTALHSPENVPYKFDNPKESVLDFLINGKVRTNSHAFYTSILELLAINIYDTAAAKKRPLQLADLLSDLNLSDGERCRLAMGRCLATKKPLVLFDCPEYGLNDEQFMETFKEIASYAAKHGQTVIFTCNKYPAELETMIDGVIEINERQITLRSE